ncbi:MAG: S41 family peptidase [Candidatus Nomurabacteria bacterium]|nr:MAG: S41 family peptidase [Candidatus Nomurabacteria bacterium]HRV75779.1 S41 family peptidase [Candidatus Saccharimonadales bacterium]
MSKNKSFKTNTCGYKKKKLLGLIFVALVFFALGYSSQNITLPKVLRGSSVKVDASINVDVQEIYSKLRERFDGELNSKEVEAGIKKGLVSATGDPYTTFFTKDEYNDFKSSLDGRFSGIGAELGKNGEQLVIIAPLDGSPAEKAGLKPGDAILSIDGVLTDGMGVDIAVSKIRGEEGTKVKLKISQDGALKEVEVIREAIKVDSVKYEKVNNDTGYIKVSRFAEDTDDLVSKGVKELSSQGANKFILDLRNNGGGYVASAVNVAGVWLDNKVVLSERFRGREMAVKRTSSNPLMSLDKSKLVVLVNEGSASASEILAASLNENAGIQLVGQKTFGKGSVQDIVPLEDGAWLKITIAHWFTPKGKTIDKVGIDPTVKIDLGANGEDLQKQKAINILNS